MNLRKSTELKGLTSQKIKLEEQISLLKKEQSLLSKEINDKGLKLKEIENKISNLSRNDKITVSEHALLRYCERILNINMKDILAEILDEDFINQYQILGKGTYPIKDKGFRVKITDGVVVTVLI